MDPNTEAAATAGSRAESHGSEKTAVEQVEHLVRSTRQVARRELATIRHYADVDLIENSDEVCLGTCVTVWLALAIWVGFMVLFRLSSISFQLPSLFGGGGALPGDAPVAMADLKGSFGSRQPGDIFQACRNSDGVIDASLDCFVQAAGPSMGDEGKARTAFMYLDCDRDFRVAQRELEAAWEAGSWVCDTQALRGAAETTTATPKPDNWALPLHLRPAPRPPAQPAPPATPTGPPSDVTPTGPPSGVTPTGPPSGVTPTGPPSAATPTGPPSAATPTGPPPAAPPRPVAPAPPGAPAPRPAAPAPPAAAGRTHYFYVDKGQIMTDAPGLGLRASKGFEDRMDASRFATWGSVVSGLDSGDGWLQASGGYLPIMVGGQAVLKRLAGISLKLCTAPGLAQETIRQELGNTIVKQVADSLGDGYSTAQVQIQLPVSVIDGVASAEVLVHPTGETAEALEARLQARKLACAAVRFRLDVTVFHLLECQVGDEEVPEEVQPSSTCMQSPAQAAHSSSSASVDDMLGQYKQMLGDHGGAVRAVQLLIRRVDAERMDEAQAKAMGESIASFLSGAASLPTSAVRDIADDRPGSVTLSGHSDSSKSKFMLATCHIVFAFGQPPEVPCSTLQSSVVRSGLAQALNAVPGVKEAVEGAPLAAADLQMGIDPSNSDVFFRLDTNFDKQVGLQEFETGTTRSASHALTPEVAKALFARLDVDGDQSLTEDEFFAAPLVAASS